MHGGSRAIGWSRSGTVDVTSEPFHNPSSVLQRTYLDRAVGPSFNFGTCIDEALNPGGVYMRTADGCQSSMRGRHADTQRGKVTYTAEKSRTTAWRLGFTAFSFASTSEFLPGSFHGLSPALTPVISCPRLVFSLT